MLFTLSVNSQRIYVPFHIMFDLSFECVPEIDISQFEGVFMHLNSVLYI